MVAQVQLTESQRTAIQYPWRGNISMILSTAGSGKTLVLTHRAIRIAKDLVTEGDFGARLLCVCYNRNAAEEMQDRIASLLQVQRLADYVFVSRDSSTMPNTVTIEVRTFHALGFYILKSSVADQRRYINLDGRYISALTGAKLKTKFFEALQVAGFLSGADTERRRSPYLSKLLRELADEKGVLFDKQCGELLKTGKLQHEFRSRKGELDVYEKMLSEQNACDYSDMIRKTVMLLYYSQRTNQRIRKRYRAVLVDEFQDMSASQVYLCKALVDESKSLTLVGDDDQQIYSFRTGLGWCCHDVLQTVFSQIDTLTLNENHRCTGAVVKAAYAVINHNTNRVSKDIKAVRGIGLPVEVISCKNKQLEMEFVIRRVRAILPRARKDGHRIILLFRRNNLLNEFRRRFTQERIQTTKKATAPHSTKRIGSLTLRVYALFSLLKPNIELKDFLWAANAVSPCTEDSFLQDVLESIEDNTMDDGDLPQPSEVHRDQETDEDPRDSKITSTWLGKIRLWYKIHTGSVDEEERCTVEMLQTLLSIADVLDLKLRTIGRLEDLVHQAAALLSPSTGTSETVLSSQNAINYEAEGQVSSYGSEDPDEQSPDNEAFDVLLSVARQLDEEAYSQRSSAVDETGSSKAPETNEKDSDDDDFAQMFCRDRDLRTTKKRKTEGINPVSTGQGEALVGKGARDQQIEKLCKIAGEKFRTIDKEWLKNEASRDAVTVLSTAHGAKGCTFPYVFLCGADSDAFPVGGNRAFCNPMQIMWGSCEELNINGPNPDSPSYQEERRLFFVALTRTVTQFVCTYSSQGIGTTANCSQSPFIREMLEGLQWDPKYITESVVNCHEDILNLSTPRKKCEGEVVSMHPVKEEEQEVK